MKLKDKKSIFFNQDKPNSKKTYSLNAKSRRSRVEPIKVLLLKVSRISKICCFSSFMFDFSCFYKNPKKIKFTKLVKIHQILALVLMHIFSISTKIFDFYSYLCKRTLKLEKFVLINSKKSRMSNVRSIWKIFAKTIVLYEMNLKSLNLFLAAEDTFQK